MRHYFQDKRGKRQISVAFSSEKRKILTWSSADSDNPVS